MAEVELRRNKSTGEMEAYKDGTRIGKVVTIDDIARLENEYESNRQHESSVRGS